MRPPSSHPGTGTTKSRLSARPSPSQAGGMETDSQKAVPSKPADAKHTNSHPDKNDDRPGRTSTSNSTESTKHGNSNWQKGPASTTGQHTGSSVVTTARGTPGWQHSLIPMIGRGPYWHTSSKSLPSPMGGHETQTLSVEGRGFPVDASPHPGSPFPKMSCRGSLPDGRTTSARGPT